MSVNYSPGHAISSNSLAIQDTNRTPFSSCRTYMADPGLGLRPLSTLYGKSYGRVFPRTVLMKLYMNCSWKLIPTIHGELPLMAQSKQFSLQGCAQNSCGCKVYRRLLRPGKHPYCLRGSFDGKVCWQVLIGIIPSNGAQLTSKKGSDLNK